eukprot:CAMPEP_0196600570 /NCGR_PEP_ID=MMETSP1081-20130531/95457_1 /TAXON_ID=36882 /ORGANISM="Pyramimonas amylifera, Strain CCMP720" /LENGTH=148 /DNA_ID=CAMNT_0041926413 /DNA_START=109 /DNA_END=552 /DNA_ORIENTATION=-
MTEQVNFNVTSLSQKLLEGWTLLQESCPNATCNVPLVRNKEKEKVYCVSCRQFFNASSLEPIPGDHCPEANYNTDMQSQYHNSQENQEEEEAGWSTWKLSEEETERRRLEEKEEEEVQEAWRRRDAQCAKEAKQDESALLAAKMLEGW